MRVSSSSVLPPPAVNHARPSGRPDAAAPAETAPPPAPVTTPEPEVSEAPAESGKAHGLVRAAEHSHRSDVAALRQWINHPDLRSDLTLPDLSTEHKGRGFEKAVAAYEAAMGSAAAPPATDSTPVVTQRDEIVTGPVVVVTQSDPLLEMLLPESSSVEMA